ncbi:hypothetical protein KI387_032358, partial [Taxus chinensis]
WATMHLWPTMKLRNSFKLAYLKRIDTNTRKMKSEAANRQGLLQDQPETERTETFEAEKNGGPTLEKAPIGACCEALLLILCCCTCFCCG